MIPGLPLMIGYFAYLHLPSLSERGRLDRILRGDWREYPAVQMWAGVLSRLNFRAGLPGLSLRNPGNWAKPRWIRALSGVCRGFEDSTPATLPGVQMWARQREVIEKLMTPSYQVLVRAGHTVGKTFVAACRASWFYDSFNPSLTLCTAPTQSSLRDEIFAELRKLRCDQDRFSPKDTLLEDTSTHVNTPRHTIAHHRAPQLHRVRGLTTAERLLTVDDEAAGIRPRPGLFARSEGNTAAKSGLRRFGAVGTAPLVCRVRPKVLSAQFRLPQFPMPIDSFPALSLYSSPTQIDADPGSGLAEAPSSMQARGQPSGGRTL